MNMTIDDYLDYLEVEEERRRKENKESESKMLQNNRDAELERLKQIRTFEEDLLKAELISKEFD